MSEWQPIETAPGDLALKEFLFRNGKTAVAPGFAPGPAEVTEDFDTGWIPTHWRPHREMEPPQ